MGIIYTAPTFKPRRCKKNNKNASGARVQKRPFVPMRPREVDVIGPRLDQYKSKIDDFLRDNNPNNQGAAPAVVYEGELALREAVARSHAEALKRCVAPAYNKGAYTLIVSSEQAKWIGRK